MFLKLPIFIVGLLALVACQTAPLQVEKTLDSLPYAVGMKKISLEDKSRNRSLPITLWYPAVGESRTNAVNETIYVSHYAQKQAEAKAGKFPLVLVSHGTGGTVASMLWIAEYLAGHGYWVAAVDHPDDSWPNATPEGLLRLWDRPLDLSRILDGLQQQASIAQYVDFDRTAALGHSSGGYTALALAGARFYPEMMQAHCNSEAAIASCALADKEVLKNLDQSPASLSYRDPRFKAIVSMAPTVGPGLSQESLSSVDVPVLVVIAEQDELLGMSPYRVARSIPDAKVMPVSPAGHFVFLPVCNDIGIAQVAEICVDLPGVDRAAIQSKVKPAVVNFLDATL